MERLKHSWLWLIASLLLTACGSGREAYVADVVGNCWQEGVVVRVSNQDTRSERELKLFLRLDPDFREDSLTVRIETLTPDSLRTEELHHLVFTPPRRISSLHAVEEISYRRGVQLQIAGNYYFIITPLRPVHGVEAVGVLFKE